MGVECDVSTCTPGALAECAQRSRGRYPWRFELLSCEGNPLDIDFHLSTIPLRFRSRAEVPDVAMMSRIKQEI